MLALSPPDGTGSSRLYGPRRDSLYPWSPLVSPLSRLSNFCQIRSSARSRRQKSPEKDPSMPVTVKKAAE